MEENKSIEINPTQPFELKKEMELKIYAIAAIKKDLFDKEQMAVIKDKLMISTSMAYNDAEAVMGAAQGIKGLGFDPNLYVIPSAMISRPVKDIIAMTQTQPGFTVPPVAPAVEEKPK